VVHGLLHLCGYDDKSDADVRIMRDREAELLAEAGLSNRNPFALVGRSRASATSASPAQAFPSPSESQPWSG
jgi:hypothetical protein